jgi:hypothetical protein
MKNEIVFRLSEPMKFLDVERRFELELDINASLLNDSDLCFISIIINYDLFCLDTKNLDLFKYKPIIIKYHPVSEINAPIYFRESKISPGIYEEKWRELNSDELEKLKYLMNYLKNTYPNEFKSMVSYYFAYVRNCKLKEIGI